MRRLAKEYLSGTFAKFLVAGGIAAAVNVLSRIGFSHYMGYAGAIVLAYLCGMVTAFVLNKLFVFEASSRDETLRQMGMFALINGLAIVQTLLVSYLLADWLLPAAGVHDHVETIAHVVGVMVPVFTSFLGHKYLSFRPQASL